MVKVTDPITPLQNAQRLADLGLQVFPARHADPNKGPLIKWAEFQKKPVTATHIQKWFSGARLKNYWVLCGKQSGVVVLDTDSDEGDAWWRSQPGMAEAMDATATVRTSKGHHYWFRLPTSYKKAVQGWAVHPETHDTDNLSWDFRAEGGGVLAPPSVHETGHVYAWVRPYEAMIDAPLALLDGTIRQEAPPTRKAPGAVKTAGGATVTGISGGGRVASLLANLLANPPAEGGRNAWLASVAGHYANQYRNQYDLYEVHCRQANAMASPPLDEPEFVKTIESLWTKEQGKDAEDLRGFSTFNAAKGWINGSGRRLFTQTRTVDPETGKAEFAADEWANFDIKAMGVSESEDGDEVDYWVRVFRDVGPVDVILPGRVLGDTARLNVWMANLRVSVLPPDNMFPRGGAHGVRIMRYLETQEPPKMRVTRVLGWDKTILAGRGGFITHEGVITAEGVVEFTDAAVRPDPALQSRGVAAHRYGTSGSKKEARRVLREVLTFQEETVCSVFGAWWAACLLKPQMQQASSLFPFMAVEAPSESGKTNGFFDLMVQLNGNTRGETVPTFAALRNMTASHRNGIVWVDDLDDPRHLGELLRAATSNGTITKMGDSKAGSWTATSDSQIVAPIVISGESLGMDVQKALIDRAVALAASSPTSRMSLHNPSRPQWDDVLKLREEYPSGLSALAGWFVELALQHQDQTMAALKQAKSIVGKGRNADKNAILLAGAKLLDAFVADSRDAVTAAWAGEGVHYARVLAWATNQAKDYTDSENALTLEVIPWALNRYGWPTSPAFSEFGDHTPVWIEQEETGGTLDEESATIIRFNTQLLAEAWKKNESGRVEVRTHSPAALASQAKHVAKKVKNTNTRLVGGTGKVVKRYQFLTGALAAQVLARSRS